MKNVGLIKQPAGIGDVFYLQKFASYFYAQCCLDELIWPLRDDILWIRDYIGRADKIKFCALSEDFIGKDTWYYSGVFTKIINLDDKIRLAFASPDGYQVAGKRIMESKYDLIGTDDSNWYDHFNFRRKKDKEDELYAKLGLVDGSKYVFLNSYSNTDIKYNNTLDSLCFDLPRVELQIIPGFTLFDWCRVIEEAQEIHTVHTSVNYIIEKLDIKASVYNMYQGSHSTDVQYIPFAKNPTFIRNEDI